MNNNSIIELIYDASSLLDEENFDQWLELCSSDFGYRITAFSDELGKPMTWMQQDKSGMAHVFSNVRNHERYSGRLRRHVSMPRISINGEVASVASVVAVYHTETNGATQLYAIARYRDVVKEITGRMFLAEREVYLDTRRLPFGSHVPI